VVSKIAPVEDMRSWPMAVRLMWYESARVPSRMNVGQIWKTTSAGQQKVWRENRQMLAAQTKTMVKELRSFLKEIYNQSGKVEDI